MNPNSYEGFRMITSLAVGFATYLSIIHWTDKTHVLGRVSPGYGNKEASQKALVAEIVCSIAFAVFTYGLIGWIMK
jgi:CobQ-like glutamine amidotransferase family enzyme